MGVNSTKRKKQLNAYINKKLKKEERQEILERLSKSHFSNDLLKSSSSIGQRITRKQRNEVEEKSRKAGLLNDVVETDEEEGKGDMKKMSITNKLGKPSASMTFPKRAFAKELSSSEDNEETDEEEVGMKMEAENFKVEKITSINLQNNLEDKKDIDELTKEEVVSVEEPFRSKTSRRRVSDDEEVQGLLSIKALNPLKESIFEIVERSENIQEQRSKLPIYAEEQRIMEQVSSSDVVLLCGETGSGKTTQVPQFLYEAGFGQATHPLYPGYILVTQPRRVAAISTSIRVGQELGPTLAHLVGYQIRYEKHLGKDTIIRFMTDGLVLRILAGDFWVKEYSVIIIDEAHERNLNTDLLIGLLSRIIKMRRDAYELDPMGPIKPLKLIIMSATLRVTDFSDNNILFPLCSPPIIRIPVRQYSVTIHFNKKTPISQGEMLDDIYKKVVKLHSRCPPGGVLIFVTGQNEVWDLVHRLKKKFPSKSAKEEKPSFEKKNENEIDLSGSIGIDSDAFEIKPSTLSPALLIKHNKKGISGSSKKVVVLDGDLETMIGLEDKAVSNIEDMDTLEDEVYDLESDVEVDEEGQDLDSNEEEEDLEDDEDIPDRQAKPIRILPLYSLLPMEQQLLVFQHDDTTERLCVIATNVAETSITIPGIRYVVDGGRVKERHYGGECKIEGVDHPTEPITCTTQNDTERFEIQWISKASSSQRAGRAGRTGPGHVYRLYSSALYEDLFEEHTLPQILLLPMDTTLLTMKAMGIDKVDKFPFPTSPSPVRMKRSEALLLALNALELLPEKSPPAVLNQLSDKQRGRERFVSVITELGRKMSVLPLPPRLSRLLFKKDGGVGKARGLLWTYLVPLVSALSVGDPFLFKEEGEVEEVADPEVEVIGKDGGKQRSLSNISYQRRLKKFEGPFPSSDILRLLTVIGAYLYLPSHQEKDAFCKEYGLLTKLMKEMELMIDQLFSTLKNAFEVKEEVTGEIKNHWIQYLKKPTQPPSIQQMEDIIKIFFEGFPDHIGKLVPSFNKKERPLYQILSPSPASSSFNVNTHFVVDPSIIYIHPASCLSKLRPPPQYILYETLFQSASKNKNISMKNVSILKSEWIPEIANQFCTFGPPLESPPPFYDPNKEDWFCYSIPTYKTHWTLPPTLQPLLLMDVPISPTSTLIRHIAFSLLSGVLYPSLLPLVPYLQSPPSLFLKENLTLPKIMSVLQALWMAGIKHKSDLEMVWTSKKRFLLLELKAWLPIDQHSDLEKSWPPNK